MSSVIFTRLGRLDSLASPLQLPSKRPVGLSTSSTSMGGCLEDMLMTETLPLDPGSDSGEDLDENTMRHIRSHSPTPSFPYSAPSPSALIAETSSKQKNSAPAISHPSFELDVESEPSERKFLKHRRPTVTFELDECRPLEQAQEELSALPTIEGNARSPCAHFEDREKSTTVSMTSSASLSMSSFQLRDSNSPGAPHSLEPSSTRAQELELQALDNRFEQLSCIKNHTVIPECALSPVTTHTPVPALTSSPTTTTNSLAVAPPPQKVILSHVLSEPATSELLVALFDRPSEMETLVASNTEFFNLVNSSLAPNTRAAFKNVLFTPRQDLSDRDWMVAIAQRLESHPCLLQKFKAIVGWIGSDVDSDDENDDDDDGNGHRYGNGRRKGINDNRYDDDCDDDDYGYGNDDLEQVEIKWFRDLDGFTLDVFEKCYPQFFVNARERLQGRRLSLGGDQRDRYVVFRETLELCRKQLACDNAWTRRVNGCLDKCPELLLQFKEIIAYEIGNDD
ncbi:hypothetical protein BG004_004902 [Podila humilis]|nr:hypothetical protein BG004_004902 [Podila humilis]